MNDNKYAENAGTTANQATAEAVREMINNWPTPAPQAPMGERYYLKEVSVVPVENGFIVTIGCKKFVSETWEKAAQGIGEYFTDPAAAEKKFCRK